MEVTVSLARDVNWIGIATFAIVLAGAVIAVARWLWGSAWPRFARWYTYRFDPPPTVLADGEQHDFQLSVRTRMSHTLTSVQLRAQRMKRGRTNVPHVNVWMESGEADSLPRRIKRGETLKLDVHVRATRALDGFLVFEAGDGGGVRTRTQPFQIVEPGAED